MPNPSKPISRSWIPRTSVASILRLLVAAALVTAPVDLWGQDTIRAGGIVLRTTDTDTVPVPGVTVVLHRVSRDFQGALDSVRTDAAGRFRLSFLADTASVFLLSTSYADIQYLSPPIHTNPARPDTAVRLFVADTSTTVPVETSARHIVVGQPSVDGTRQVVDVIGLANRGRRTRVAGAEQQPTWQTPLDRAMIAFDVGSGDFSPEAVFFTGGVVEVFGPITPGEKSLMLRYRVPADMGRWLLTFPDTVFDFSVLVEDPSVRVIGPVAEAPQPQNIGGRVFHTFRARPTARDTIVVAFPGAVRANGDVLLVALVLLTGAAMMLGVAWWRRRAIPVRADEPVDVLVRRLATLDHNFRATEATATPEDVAQYRARRAALKTELTRALARRRTPT